MRCYYDDPYKNNDDPCKQSNPLTHAHTVMNYNEDPFSGEHPLYNPSVQDQLKIHLSAQDAHLDHIYSSLQQVRHQTDAINIELREHNELLVRLGERMDDTESGFERASRRVRLLYSELTDKKFTWTASVMIFVLTFLLIILLCT